MFAAERLKQAETTKTPKGPGPFASPAVQVEVHGILLRRRGAKTWRIRFDVKQETKCFTKLGYHDICSHLESGNIDIVSLAIFSYLLPLGHQQLESRTQFWLTLG